MVSIEKTPLSTLEKQDWTWQGYNIRYTVQGTGQPLVLIHGFGASIGHWRKNIPVLAAAGYQVFALDLLGFGDSAKPPLDYTVELWQQQLQDFWQEKIQTPAVWVGNSIGGLLALTLLAHSPEQSAGGVLINCAGGLSHRPEELNPPLRAIIGLFNRVVKAPILGPFLFDRVRTKNRIRSTLKQVYGDRNAITEDLVDLLYQPSCDPGAHQVFASVINAPPGPKPADLLPHIQQPLLVLWGDADPWTPITGSKIYQNRATQDPQTEFYAIPNAGHCPHDEKPEQVNDYILQWLRQI
ncbi:MAG: alpha/beta fold hydrolase [Kamptonema sp. SIO4C4]|nr:alpha/beta fold hydrolase [Kamptonema sp. SIO4C4]